MAVIRNPTVGDTFNRYYFFPPISTLSAGRTCNAGLPLPVFGNCRHRGGHPLLKLGVTAPVTPPTATAPLPCVPQHQR